MNANGYDLEPGDVAPRFEQRCVAPGVTVIVTTSAAVDGAVVVFVDTEFEPTGSDGGAGLRILLNDDPVYPGVEYGIQRERA